MTLKSITTLDEYVAMARAVHGDRYDYSQTVLPQNLQDKITVICPVHGPVQIHAGNHLRGSRCLKCAGKAKLTTEEFIAKAREVHGDKYDYSQVVYINSTTKVTVICPEHGPFYPKPSNHTVNQSGCPACSGCAPTNLDVFLERAYKTHGDKYDYSRVVYRGVDNKVEIICPDHGPFWQLAADHMNGRGCIPCGVIKCSSAIRFSTEDFIAKAREIHGDKFDYNLVDYQNSQTKVQIICPKHGPFWQVPKCHLQGDGCVKCAGLALVTQEEFIARARVAHGDKYTYGKFHGLSRKIEIICPQHGPFLQTAKAHLNGHGCRACVGLQRITFETFLERARVVHGDKYDYSQVIFDNVSTPVTILCPVHGPFQQRPGEHFKGAGCAACANNRPITMEEFLARAKAVHGDKYDYSAVIFDKYRDKVEIICPKHGSFWPSSYNHALGSGCPTCANEKTTSIGEQELADWIESLSFDVCRNDRSILGSMEIDIYIPAIKLGIEYNGLYWHSDERLPHPRFHEVKYGRAEHAGIRLITVWDTDWKNHRGLVKSSLLYAFGMSDLPRRNARQCDLRQVSALDANAFYLAQHIQRASGIALVSYGLFIHDQLVACLSFSQGSNRRGIVAPGEWELTRLSTNCIVRGAASRLFKAFVRKHDPHVVWSFSDRQYHAGGLYQILGFRNDGKLASDYRIAHKRTGQIWHKSAWQRENIPARLTELGIEEPYDPANDPRNEREIEQLAGVCRIMDAGKVRWKWTRPDRRAENGITFSIDAPLFRSQKGTAFSPNAMVSVLGDIYKNARFTDTSSYTGKRSLITKLAYSGIDLNSVRQIAGHSSISTTQRYIDDNPHKIANILKSI